MTTQPGAPGTAADGYKVAPEPGRHRAPPPVPTPRAPAAVAVAAAVLTAASLTAIAGQAVAPDARAAASGATVTPATSSATTAGPLVIPTIGASGAWSPPEETQTAVRPVTAVMTPVRTRRPASTSKPVTGVHRATVAPSEPTVTPEPQPVTTEEAQPTPDAPPLDAAVTPDSATPTEEQPVDAPTETTVTVDVTGEVTVP